MAHLNVELLTVHLAVEDLLEGFDQPGVAGVVAVSVVAEQVDDDPEIERMFHR